MKGLLMICLIATAMMANAVEVKQAQILSAQEHSPISFLQQGCTYCCSGKCCAASSNCRNGFCSVPVSGTCSGTGLIDYD